MDTGHFVEMPNVPTIYSSGTAHVSCDGANLVFSVYQTRVCADGTIEKVIFANCVMPRDAWLRTKDMALFELARAERGLPSESSLRLS